MNSHNKFVQKLTDFFKSMGNEKRQEILLSVFADGKEHNITEVAERVHIAQSTASEHLALLKRAGVLNSRKVEKEVFYKLDRKSLVSIIDEIKSVLNCCAEE